MIPARSLWTVASGACSHRLWLLTDYGGSVAAGETRKQPWGQELKWHRAFSGVPRVQSQATVGSHRAFQSCPEELGRKSKKDWNTWGQAVHKERPWQQTKGQTAQVLLYHHSLDNDACPVCLLDSSWAVESKGWLPTLSVWPSQPPPRTVLMPPLRFWDKRRCDRRPPLQLGRIGRRSGFDPCPKLGIVCVPVF